FHHIAGQGELSHSLSLARAERRAKDTRGSRMASRNVRYNRGALHRSRRHMGREVRALRRVDENWKTGFPSDGRNRSRLHKYRLPHRRARDSAGSRSGTWAAPWEEGTSAHVAANRLRTIG